MSDHSDNPDDEPLDPVARRNAEDEAQVAELVGIDLDLDDKQARLDDLVDTDPIGMIWFGDDDAWVDKRIGGANGP